MKAWSKLPNAKYIDQVLADLKSHPMEFSAAYRAARAVARDMAWDMARDMARAVARDMAWGAARDAAYDAAWDPAWDMAWDMARDMARDAAWGAVAALIAWDQASKYLAMSYKELLVWYQLNEDPAAILLLPYVKARELIAEKVMA